jgi:opacity protein-like surface antigen
MYLRNPVLMLATSALLLGATSAFAEPPGPDYSRSGFYVGINGMYALNFFDDSGGLADVEDTWGLTARAGYRFRPWFAAEFLYEWANDFDTTFLVPPGASGDLTTHTITANAKFLWPAWRAQPYLLVGLGTQGVKTTVRSLGVSASDSLWGFAIRPAVGVDFYITENIVVNAEVGPVVNVFKARAPFPGTTVAEFYMSFGGGLQYRF